MLNMDLDPAGALYSNESDLSDACDHLSDELINITRAAPQTL